MKHLPNALTLLRLVLAPVVAWFFWMGATLPNDGLSSGSGFFPHDPLTLTLAAAAFVIAALTDLFDGMIARAYNAESKFGRLIDPIADKAIVGLPLLAIGSSGSAHYNDIQYWVVLAILVIVVRDIAMTVVRLNAPDGEGVRVSRLAKIKTALELALVGSFLVFSAFLAHIMPSLSEAHDQNDWSSLRALLEFKHGFFWFWNLGLFFTAALSVWTAWQYLRPLKPVP